MVATRIELYELRLITNNFSDAHKVGSGGYAEVYKAIYNGEEIAVKWFDLSAEIDDEQFMNELGNYMKVQHPNIVRLVGYCNEVASEYIEHKDGPPVFGKRIYKVLCFEYMHGASLDKHLSGNSLGHDWPTHYQIIKGTCEGLCYLHYGCERPILHLDLKPANILLDKHKNPKIADFGWTRIESRVRVEVIASVSGTTKYMAPELRREGVVSAKADVFSLGVTIIDVIGGSSGLELYREHGAKKFVEYVRTYWRERDDTADLYQVEACTKIAICCLHTERHQRPTMKEIMVNLNDIETQVLGKGLHALTVNSSLHIPHKLSSDSSGRGPLDVVIVYAFDCTNYSPAWYTVNKGIFWLVQEKLTHFVESCMGYIYVMTTPNTYTTDMRVVDSAETKKLWYTAGDRRTMTCTKNMASGLAQAHRMVSNRGYNNGVILFFSDGLINKGDFFDGTETFVSHVPVHTFTLGGDEYNDALHSIAAKSPGGVFHPIPVPERPNLSAPFCRLLDRLFNGNKLDVVLDAQLQSELPDIQKLKLHFLLEPNNLMPMVLKLELLKAITSDFSITSEIGRGGYGVVYKGVFPSGEIIAVKKLESHLVKEETFRSEVSSLSGMKHQNVVQIVGYCAETSSERIRLPGGKFVWVDSPNRMICLEYVCNGSLDKYISDETTGLEWNMRYDIIKGICSGLHFLHEKCSIVHLDLKPENILMDVAMVPKIADFGLSRMFGEQETRFFTKNRAGTLGYMALEYTIQGLITPKADIFSLGVIIIQIVTGHKKYPLSAYFQSVNENDCPQSSDTSFHDFVQKVLGRWTKKFMSMPNHQLMEKYTQQVKQCITIALKCVDRDMEKRPTAEDIIHGLTAADQDDLSPMHQSDSECSPSELSGGNENI